MLDNAHYSRRKCLEVVGIPTAIPNDLLEANVSKAFDKFGVHVKGKDIQACHRLEDNDRAIVKFSIRKDSLQILCVKKDLKSLDPAKLDLPEGMKGMGKLHVFFASNGTIKVKILEDDGAKPFTYAADLKKMFPDINIDNL